MKNLRDITLIIVFSILAVFISCSDDDEPAVVVDDQTEVEEEEEIADADGDGVADADDTCPDTPSGETVNENGCSDSQLETNEDSGATNFVETFSYSDDQVVEEIEYGGAFAEWPQPDSNDPENGGTVSIEDGKFKWEWSQVLEAAIGFEFEEPLDLTNNSILTFDYEFPVGTIFSVYFFDSEGGEGQLFAGTDFIMTMGADGMSEAEIDLSLSTALADADPNTTDISKFAGFYLIAGLTDETGALLPDAEGSILYFDNIIVGDGIIDDANEEPAELPLLGFTESFNYESEQVVEDIAYDGVFAEWPQPDSNDPENGGTVTIEGNRLKWVWSQVLEAAIGFEFDVPMDLSSNPILKFKYQFPANTIFSVYFFDSEGGEGQLFAGTDFIITNGAEGMTEAEVDLSKSSSLADADPNTTDLELFAGFYLIAGLTDETGALLPDAEGSVLYFDDISVGEEVEVEPEPLLSFMESFSYGNDQVVADITYNGVFAEWPQPDANDPENGGTVSIEDEKLKWVWSKVHEAAIGFEFEAPMDLSANAMLKFKYQLPAGTIFSVYFFDYEGGEGQLFAGDDFIMTLGAEGMTEVEVDLSKSSSLADADPNTTDLELFAGFYLIAGLTDATGALLPDAEGSILYFDDISVGE